MLTNKINLSKTLKHSSIFVWLREKKDKHVTNKLLPQHLQHYNNYLSKSKKSLVREAFKKKSVTFFSLGGGGSGPVFVTLFFLSQKHGLKWLNIAF